MEYETILNDFNGNERNFNAIYNYLLQNPSLYPFIKIKQLNIKINPPVKPTASPLTSCKVEEPTTPSALSPVDNSADFIKKMNESLVLNQMNNYYSMANNMGNFVNMNDLVRLNMMRAQPFYGYPLQNSLNTNVLFNNLILNLSNSLKNSSTSATLN
jgi:hypothetical protein